MRRTSTVAIATSGVERQGKPFGRLLSGCPEQRVNIKSPDRAKTHAFRLSILYGVQS